MNLKNNFGLGKYDLFFILPSEIVAPIPVLAPVTTATLLLQRFIFNLYHSTYC